MGCWGITAFESDAGLDAAGLVRKNLPEDGKLELKKIIEEMKKDQYSVPDVKDGDSHTGAMALAEIITKFLEQDIDDLDYNEEWAANDNKFSDITSFTADKEDIRWIRNYMSDTLKYAIENAEVRAKHGTQECDQRNGWFKEEHWHGWQNHMSTLVSRMDTLLDSPEENIELIQPQEQSSDMTMQM